ncbi:sugar phosphate isomerase/epimerase [Jejubacter calystegiae]|uniref:Sugar phosphate isomerase/epimerase n=1 Tax=Jejubacter calystegiae TaxID=2579935 RepID=A0A4P8YF12_9ENTR|nr:sugar phosphate isomerase/epimerase family protein [Jejubacter calystegiae]QCT19080.1 sugar phosphate isomerase/epimerase [Jejubacter calystegiae]
MQQKLEPGVNTAMFDGVEPEVAFSTIREAGFRYIELAYNQGYVGNLDPSLFGPENAARILDLLEKYQLQTRALGCTMNLAAPDAVAQFTTRIQFATRIGATFLNACIGKREDRQTIIANLQELAPLAADSGCVICIENGGDPNYDVFAVAEEGMALLEAINSPAVAFNIDPGNTVSLRPERDAINECIHMLPGARHAHIKDVLCKEGEFFFPAIGEGVLDYQPLLRELEQRAIPCSLEIPLRMHRSSDTLPHRASQPVDPAISLEVLKRSRQQLEALLGYPL